MNSIEQGGNDMIDIQTWVKDFTEAVNKYFMGRVAFIGLQGSYARGEASDTSDIDMVVILDEVTFDDVKAYYQMIDTMPYRERICGFLAGKEELLHWEPCDLFQFYFDTTPIQGELDDLCKMPNRESVARAVKLGACNIYHACVHNMLYDKSEEILRGLYKAASFVVQAACFLKTGKYIRYQSELADEVSFDDKAVITIFLQMKRGASIDFDSMSEQLFAWAKHKITSELF